MRDAQARMDWEDIKFASRMVSGTLDPRVISGRTEFSKRGFISQNAPELSALQTMVERMAAGGSSPAALTELGRSMMTLHHRNLTEAEAERLTLLVGECGEVVPIAITDALSRLQTLGSCFGTFNFWIKQPVRATYQSLNRAWQKGESDSEEFFAFFRDRMLGIPVSQLDPYLAQVLLGVHVSGGEVLMAGDIHQGRKRQNLAALSDDEIRAAILRRARSLKFADKKGRADLIRVHPPGQKKNSGRTFDAIEHAVFLEEIDQLFTPNLMETGTVMHSAIIEACTREDFERIFRKVGLSREHARFVARVAAGRAVRSDDPDAAEAITKKSSAIFQAMKDDKVFGDLFG